MGLTRSFLQILFLCLAASVTVWAQQPLTNQRIIELARSGVHADELQRIISTAPEVDFNLTPAGTDALLQAGVSQDVIKAMAARENGSTAASLTTHAGDPTPAKAIFQPETLPRKAYVDIFTGYSYLNVDTNDLSSRQSLNGFETSASVGIVKHLAAEGSFGGYFKGNVLGSGVDVHDFNLLGGPRVNFGGGFVHALVGFDRLTGSAYGLSASQNALAAAFGGGVQSKPFARHFAIRTSADYVLSRHNILGGSAVNQNNFRVSGGIVFVFGPPILR